jgi:hypothetical protein
VTTPFGPAQPVAELDDVGENQHLRLSSDYLTAYFSSTRGSAVPVLHLYTAVRPSLVMPFANVTAMSTLNAGNTEDARSTVTGDGLTIFFHSTRGPDTIYVAKRAKVGDAFGAPAPMMGAGAGFDSPFVREDGAELYYVSAGNILVSTIDNSGALGPPVAFSLGGSGIATAPTVTPDDLVLYFGSSRTDVSAGANDIWVATRSTANDPWGTPVHVGELATAGDEKPSFITRDRCTLYFYRNESDGGGGSYETYVATRKPK